MKEEMIKVGKTTQITVTFDDIADIIEDNTVGIKGAKKISSAIDTAILEEIVLGTPEYEVLAPHFRASIEKEIKEEYKVKALMDLPKDKIKEIMKKVRSKKSEYFKQSSDANLGKREIVLDKAYKDFIRLEKKEEKGEHIRISDRVKLAKYRKVMKKKKGWGSALNKAKNRLLKEKNK